MAIRPIDIGDFGDNELGAPAVKPGSLSARALAGAEPPYLKGLNPEQRAAVETTEGPLLVLAGAGTGKTRVLTTRLAHILATSKAWPSQILAVTFTNKAAREMKDRIGALIGGVVEGMTWLGTFHAIGVKILRHHAELVGLKSGFSILDTDDQIRLLKQLLEAHDIDEKRWPARQLASLIDGWKNRGLTPQKLSAGEANSFANGLGGKLYAEYQQRLKVVNAADFGDLLLEVLRLFQEHPDVLKDYQRRFKYMLVDEYQDTNVAQYLWLRLLAQGHKNICCVGDDDQSIYGWRGAEVDNILRFEKDFPGAKVIRLERNYRSTPQILGAASGLIAKNESRLGKTLHTDRNDGETVTVRSHWDGDEEARVTGDDIESLQRKGEKLSDMAILVRASFQMRAFEDRFITLGVPYRVVGGPRFYERAEVRDGLAYFKVTASPDNDLAFERIVNTPKRGIGDSSLKRLHQFARKQGISLYRAAEALIVTDELPNKTRTALRTLLESFGRWRQALQGLPHTELAEIILDESGYTEMWQNDKSPEAQGRLDNLKELVRSMAEFDTMAGFLEHIALVMDVEQSADDDKVNIMTLHSAKGLEFGTVFLPGWEEGLFPHQRALDEKGRAGLEEERRLAYVGITRAKRRAFISFAQNRRVHNLWQSGLPSRFIDELPEAHVEVAPMATTYGGHGLGGYGASRFDESQPFTNTYATPGMQRARERWAKGESARSTPQFLEGEMTARETEGGGYARGERVFHQKFGYGVVSRVDGNKLTIDFDKAGEKRVLDSFVAKV
ncbi:MAG: UvrD-helicase domain-containing protein [Rhizobiales bacterium]|nr:UvrD-helicase domain-containing protein [Hyphomicrobiales bacterium]MBI3672249.1 UvrD-helicase domain-containing protein [Hyphomicrobiales bacterium]